MQANLASNDITIQKLRKLAGIVKSSEKIQSSLAQKKAKKPRLPPKKPDIDKVKPEIKHHKHDELVRFVLNRRRRAITKLSYHT